MYFKVTSDNKYYYAIVAPRHCPCCLGYFAYVTCAQAAVPRRTCISRSAFRFLLPINNPYVVVAQDRRACPLLPGRFAYARALFAVINHNTTRNHTQTPHAQSYPAQVAWYAPHPLYYDMRGLPTMGHHKRHMPVTHATRHTHANATRHAPHYDPCALPARGGACSGN